jgi:lipoprotein-anchoring transpeptidase ErfK/SrfK
MRRLVVLALTILTNFGPVPAQARATRLDADAVNKADKLGHTTNGVDPGLVRAEILLDRLRFSPGVIDGRGGDNVEKAVSAYQAAQGLSVSGKLDKTTFARVVTAAPDAITRYTITQTDARSPFTRTIPRSIEKQARLKRLGYHDLAEMLAERFHMDERLLRLLNPGVRFEPGAEIAVAATTRGPEDAKAARVEIAKAERRLRAYSEDGVLLGSYPASIGSTEKPAPSGSFAVKSVARNPTWTYNPSFRFRGIKAKEPVRLPPGPNNPVGAVWIDLTAETYGIHGTPEPRLIGKSFSHGCVRLTNWDALDLASLVHKGTTVDFAE